MLLSISLLKCTAIHSSFVKGLDSWPPRCCLLVLVDTKQSYLARWRGCLSLA